MKRFFKKVTSFLFFVCVLLFLWQCCHGWIYYQMMKAKGMYYIYRGDQAYAQNNMNKTLDFYKKGLEYYPAHYEAWFNLGNIYSVYEDYYSAVDAYKNAIKYNPKFVMAKMNLGIVYSEDLGFFDEAIEQFSEIQDIKLFNLWVPFVYSNIKSIRANKGIAYFNRGVAYKQKAMYLPLEEKYKMNTILQQAINSYTEALKYLKNNYDVYYNRAVAYHLRGDSRLAGLDYCKAIKIKPTRFEAHYNLAVLLRGLSKYRESIDELKKAAWLSSETNDVSELQTAYIFNLLNEVSRRFVNSDNHDDGKIGDKPASSINYTYVNGRIVANEDFNEAMEKNFRTCAGFDYFTVPEEEEDF